MKNFTKILLLSFIAISGVLLFQAQEFTGNVDNPNLDHVPPTYYSDGIMPTIPSPLAVVTVGDYDNWDLGVDLQEPHMSVSPINPTWFFNAYNINNAHRTLDGESWTAFTPVVPGSSGDPWTAYDSLGNLYYETMKSPVTGCWVIKSTNGGVTWNSAVSGPVGNDRNTMVADQTAGPYSNYIYTGMTNSSSGASFSRSTDGGATFTLITNLTPHNLPGVHMAIGPNGTIQGGCVYTVTYSGSNAAGTYNFYRSTDGGLTHTLRSNISGIGIIGTEIGGRSTINGARCRPYPWICADQSYGPNRGRLYLVYCNNPGGVNGLRPDVYCRYSTDQGATWSANVVVNDDANTANTNNWFPSAWCEKTTGKLYINWYDMRLNSPANQMVDVYATFSTTGGTSFVANQRVTNTSWTYPGGSCGAPCYKGDYHMIAPNKKVSLSAWFDGRNSGQAGSFVGYFPDFAMRTTPSIGIPSGTNDSGFAYVSIPGVKLYTDTAMFSATVLNPPGVGTLTLTFLNRTTPATQTILTTFPDSLRLRVRTTGGVPPAIYNISVTGKGPNGTPVHIRNVAVNVGLIAINNNNTTIPDKFYLYQNYPNPFNPSTKIRFDLSKSGNVKLAVYDVSGKQVTEITNANYNAGEYSFDFNAENLSTGVYFYKLETPEFTSIRKMILIK